MLKLQMVMEQTPDVWSLRRHYWKSSLLSCLTRKAADRHISEAWTIKIFSLKMVKITADLFSVKQLIK